MEPLTELMERAHVLATRHEAALAPASWDRILREFGPDGLLQERGNAWFLVATAYFRAGAFREAAAWFRRWRDNALEHARWHESRGDLESARYVRVEIARHAWSFGDTELFERYVREGCEPTEGVAPRLDVLAALFLAWSVVGHRFHPEHWLACWAAEADEERRRLAAQYRGHDAALAVARGIVVDARLARGWYWLGERERALAHARTAEQAFADLVRVRPAGLVVHEKRAWRRRIEGLVHLLSASDGPHHARRAAAAFGKALAAAAAVHGQDWKDLVLLHLTALRAQGEPHPLLDAFAEHYPHLAHLTRLPPAP